MEIIALIIPAFIAGLLTFLAPCALPLLPGYLAFISGASFEDLKNPLKAHRAKLKIFFSGLLFIVGFSVVFIILGSLLGLVGSALAGYRMWLSRIGGIFVIIFGLFMLGVFKIPFLNVEKHIFGIKHLKPGNPVSSFIFGSVFALGWTPCVGPVLGAILTLAAVSATVGKGAFLLFVFSLGLAIPFILVALFIASAAKYISKVSRYLNFVYVIGGVFLIFMGILIFADQFAVWILNFYQWFDFINYDRLFDYL